MSIVKMETDRIVAHWGYLLDIYILLANLQRLLAGPMSLYLGRWREYPQILTREVVVIAVIKGDLQHTRVAVQV
jgi:hypothetical protein